MSLLQDGLLAISEIDADGSAQGEFAFLSACKTAVGGVDALDEAITLVAALQYAGWQHVIGTLWSVWDRAAADVAANVYSYLLAEGTFRSQDASVALHHALRKLRDNGLLHARAGLRLSGPRNRLLREFDRHRERLAVGDHDLVGQIIDHGKRITRDIAPRHQESRPRIGRGSRIQG